MRVLDWVVCPGCGDHKTLAVAEHSVMNGGWSCAECSYTAEGGGRPPTIGEIVEGTAKSGDWNDVDISAYVRRIVVLVLVGADKLNSGAARTLGFALMTRYPGIGKALMPELAKATTT